MRRLCITLCAALLTLPSAAQPKQKTENVILITLDGMRWQEVFGGAEMRLMANKKFTDDSTSLKKLFWNESAEKRRELLMPFFWQVIGKQGQLYGNRNIGNKVNTTNTMRFSYPGYNEILTGFADDVKVTSNDKFYNPNKNVLEFIQSQKGFANKVAAFTSWETFPWIINTERNKIPINAGVMKATGNLSDREKLLNDLSFQTPNDPGETRLDGLTFQYAFEYLKKNHPRLLFISFDETDHYAHEGHYDRYLKSAHYTDDMIRTMWEWIQASPDYRNKTTLIVTTDHGRGNKNEEDWRHHGSKVPEADQIWFAFLGPDTPAIGEMKGESQLYQNQVAKTLAACLGVDYNNEPKQGAVITTAIAKSE